MIKYLNEFVVFKGCRRNALVLFDVQLIVLYDLLSLLHHGIVKVVLTYFDTLARLRAFCTSSNF